MPALVHACARTCVRACVCADARCWQQTVGAQASARSDLHYDNFTQLRVQHADVARDVIERVSPAAVTSPYTDVSQLSPFQANPVYDETQLVKSMSELEAASPKSHYADSLPSM